MYVLWKRLPCGAHYRTKARSLSISIGKFTPRCSQVWMGDFHTSKPNIEALSPTEPNKLCLTQYSGKVSIKSFHCRRNSPGSSAVLTANTPAKKSFGSAKNSVGFWFWALWGSHSWTSTSISTRLGVDALTALARVHNTFLPRKAYFAFGKSAQAINESL